MADEPDPENGVFRVSHFLIVGPNRFSCVSDLIFEDDRPYAVLAWQEVGGTHLPSVKIALDPQRLENSTPAGYFHYSGDIHDPRPIQ